MVPLVIHQAYLNNYMPLAGLIAQTDIERANAMYIGLPSILFATRTFQN